MKTNQFNDYGSESELKQSRVINDIAAAIAAGTMLIDVRIDRSPLHYHPFLSELNLDQESDSTEAFIFDKAILAYTKRGTLGMSTGDFLENALNGNVKQLKKDIDRYAVALKYDENNVLTGFKIKLADLSFLNIMKIL